MKPSEINVILDLGNLKEKDKKIQRRLNHICQLDDGKIDLKEYNVKSIELNGKDLVLRAVKKTKHRRSN